MTRLSEKCDVQDALFKHLIGIGWEYLAPDEVQEDVLKLVADWARWIGVEVGRVQVRKMRSKWASCSA